MGEKWNKKTFIEQLRLKASREVTKVGVALCDFSELHADEVAWGSRSEHGTMIFKSKSDFGLIPLFTMTTRGTIRFHVNILREKGVPKPILRDFVIRLESNFLRDFDEANYPADESFDIADLFVTGAQIEKFQNCVEGVAYRLRQ